MTHIPRSAFYGCKALRSVVLHENVVSIGQEAFYDNSGLSDIIIPNSVITIEEKAFYRCSGAKQIVLGNQVSNIGANAFYGCSGISEITIPQHVAYLPDNCFGNCTKLETVNLPEGLTNIQGAFRSCSNLKNISLPSTLLSIGDYTFYGCCSLASISIPSNVTNIGSSAFQDCTALTTLNLSASLTSIGRYAFASCTNLRHVDIPQNVTIIEIGTFSDCSALSEISLPSGITSIGDNAFLNCASLRNITLPESLTTVGSSAFKNCTGLTNITLPRAVNSLSTYLFQGCSGLTSISVLAMLPPSISSSTFSGITNPITIYIPCDNKDFYQEDANWSKLNLADLPPSVVNVQSNDLRMGDAIVLTRNTCSNDEATIQAFARTGCHFVAWDDGTTDNPRSIMITQDTLFTATFAADQTYSLSVLYDETMGYVSGAGTYYPDEEATLTATALSGNRFLRWNDGSTANPRKVTITSDTTLTAEFIHGDFCGDNILWTLDNGILALNGKGAMYDLLSFGWAEYADEVESITLSSGITTIGTNAFMDLMFIPSVSIPASVTRINKRAFENCRSLSSVEFARNSSLTVIDNWAFFQCINLQDITIPEGVTTIGNGAFYGCAYLTNLTLPSTVETIDDNAFALCMKLQSMRVHAVVPPAVDSKTFQDVERTIPVYVPDGTGDAYRAAEVWKEFNIKDEADAPSGIRESDANVPARIQKRIQDGHVVIIRNGETYSVLGEKQN